MDSTPETTLSPEVLETAQAQAEADKALMTKLAEAREAGTLRVLPKPNRAERRARQRRPDRTAVQTPLTGRQRRRIHREARQLAGQLRA